MPTSSADIPILSWFLCAVENTTGMPPQPLDATPQQQREAAQRDPSTYGSSDGGQQTQSLPKGVVLGPDGKPCRSCTSAASWKSMMKQSSSPASPSTLAKTTPPAAATASLDPRADCPPDVEQLGRSTWTFLHTMAAAYPESPSPVQQSETRQFMGLFGKLYPCWVCADDFKAWMREYEPRVSSRDEFGRWMCEAHNAVNVKLGKREFDCGLWKERWREGWRDGRCD